MKKIITVILIFFIGTSLAPVILKAQDNENRIKKDAEKVKAEFIKTDKNMMSLFNDSYAYALFPNIGKGAIGVGGATGNGVVYEKGKYIGSSNMVQVTVGLQLGGQAYGEVIFFENKEALDHFKENKLEFSGQASAVAAKEGASTNVKYRSGVMIFTQKKGGLMYEASIGGQKFTFKPS